MEGVLLAGGGARRLGSIDKATIDVGGYTMLSRVLAALAGAGVRAVEVVGRSPEGVDAGSAAPGNVSYESRSEFGLEPEPGGGPVPAVAAGLERLARRRQPSNRAPIVVVLAVDLPLLGAEHVTHLVETLTAHPEAEAAVALDHRGLPNPLLAAYHLAGLQTRAALGVAGDAAALLLPERLAAVDLGRATLNVNTPEDLTEARRLVSRRNLDRGPMPGLH